MQHYLIGEVARQTGCTPETIRHYERLGLLPKPLRGSNGYRYYDSEAVRRLGFIRRCRDLGLDLGAIRELVELAAQPEASCAAVDAMAARHVAELRARIRALQALADELEATAHQCRGGSIVSCRILDSLTPELSTR
ncbi:MAG: helix-turn-helix domain-containing protein [Ectothiorhodospiraceae bacterium]|nr:helix-turn-helix domain-containing protein [Ectothiorhodospiraceae bacterium]MCH8506825.1 helix-turn-helix domain-containing protein [Ectothiorhodospiraceae bacterium]